MKEVKLRQRERDVISERERRHRRGERKEFPQLEQLRKEARNKRRGGRKWIVWLRPCKRSGEVEVLEEPRWVMGLVPRNKRVSFYRRLWEEEPLEMKRVSAGVKESKQESLKYSRRLACDLLGEKEVKSNWLAIRERKDKEKLGEPLWVAVSQEKRWSVSEELPFDGENSFVESSGVVGPQIREKSQSWVKRRKLNWECEERPFGYGKLLKRLMVSGKYRVAQKIGKDCLLQLRARWNVMEGEMYLREAIWKVSPLVEVRRKKKGGRVLLVPFALRERRRGFLGRKFLLDRARKRKGKSMGERLAEEVQAVHEGSSAALQLRRQLHQQVNQNRGNRKLRW